MHSVFIINALAALWSLLTNLYGIEADCSRLFLSKHGLNGQFASPGYPQNYPSHSQCRLVFNGTADERIRITFDDFDLEPGNNAGCLFDYVDVFTVDRFGRMELEERICGSQLPAQIATVHHRVELVFKSDYASSRKGFSGRYEFIDETWQPFPTPTSGCGAMLETGVGGEILSPNYPRPYPDNTDCTWMIRVERSQQIVVSFITLDLGQSVSCATTFVAIYDGFGSPSLEPAKKVCGQIYFDKKNLWQFQSTGYRVVIRFHDQLNEYGSSGFQIAWAAVQRNAERCSQFLCRGGEYCLDGVFCIPLQTHCIDASLRCNSIPNCGAYDHSDEEMCLKQISLTALAIALPSLLFIALVVLSCYAMKRKRAKELQLQLQQQQQQQQQQLQQNHQLLAKHDSHQMSGAHAQLSVRQSYNYDVGNNDHKALSRTTTCTFSPVHCFHGYQQPSESRYNFAAAADDMQDDGCDGDVVQQLSGHGHGHGHGHGQGRSQASWRTEGSQDSYRPYTACSNIAPSSISVSYSSHQLTSSSSPFSASSVAGDTVRRRPDAAASSSVPRLNQQQVFSSSIHSVTTAEDITSNGHWDYGRVNQALGSAVEPEDEQITTMTFCSQTTQV